MALELTLAGHGRTSALWTAWVQEQGQVLAGAPKVNRPNQASCHPKVMTHPGSVTAQTAYQGLGRWVQQERRWGLVAMVQLELEQELTILAEVRAPSHLKEHTSTMVLDRTRKAP